MITHVDWFDCKVDLNRFFRTVKLKEWFHNKSKNMISQEAELCIAKLGLKKKSLFVPPNSSAAIETFVEAVTRDIESLRSKGMEGFTKPNLRTEEVKAMNELIHDETIIIKRADKGGALVIMDKENYVAEIMRQIGDQDVYRKLSQDPKFQIIRNIGNIVKPALEQGLIDKEIFDFLLHITPTTPILYTLLKVHKSMRDPPGRPIVAGTDSVLSHVGVYLDKILNPLAQRATSYVKDTTDFLLKVKELKVGESDWLVSFDVTSLYTSIVHKEGLEVVKEALSRTNFTNQAIVMIMSLLELVLTKNYFMFGDEYYEQIRGTAMGANMAPSYANLMMAALEQKFVYVLPHFPKVGGWWRYIDDIFLTWTGSREELQEFFDFLNSINETIKFTMECSRVELNFLDVLIRKDGEKLDTELFCKKTDRNNLLHYSSHHPQKMLDAIPYSQYLRAKRIVSRDEKLTETVDNMSKKFVQRGTPKVYWLNRKGD
ncbi:uncharacterized protein [Dendrobates tinctorius]|uniref:uncharacterized protein isoform X1 n=1 Tax=Dendrobates tinctorius TaxID=92724 RepID=UPI003CC9659E